MKAAAFVILGVVLCVAGAWAGGVGGAVEVRIVTDEGGVLPTYPVTMRQGMKKVYAEAHRGDHYRIEVRNRLNRRVGLVIAVDGRNIISGEKSYLRNSERMYILEPRGFGEFSGWRTAQDRINRFYFTDAPDSYAAAFGDESAMGVIAVAVFPEVRRGRPPVPPVPITPPGPHGREDEAAPSSGKFKGAPAPPAASGEAARDKAARPDQAHESAGTGFGRDEYSPARVVAFKPEKRAVENILIKYEWRSTLCRLRIVECDRPVPHPENRLWDRDGGYAPPPPDRRFYPADPGWE